jgi:hypothetical protein
MLQPQDLLTITEQLKGICSEEMCFDIRGLRITFKSSLYLRKMYPGWYHALTCDIKILPKLLNHPTATIRVIAKYRLSVNR